MKLTEREYQIQYWQLKRFSEAHGLKVKTLGNDKLHDYAGMNDEAADEFGMPFPRRTVATQPESWERKYKDLKHELVERRLMEKGWKYFPAHKRALEAEEEDNTSLNRLVS
jgi:hypothetical protein